MAALPMVSDVCAGQTWFSTSGVSTSSLRESRKTIKQYGRSNMLRVFTASVESPAGSPPIGLATSHAIPASLAMGQFWQLRDLFVLPGSRRQGAAEALVGAVRGAALTAGATRLSLATEPTTRPRSASIGGSDSGRSKG